MTTNAETALATFMQKYGPAAGPEGPLQFVVEVLGTQPDPWQADILRDLGRCTPGVSARSSHGVGKTTVAAWCIVYQAVCRFPQKTVCTAPTSGQLFDALAAETKTWFGRLPKPLQGLYDVKRDSIELIAARSESFVSFRTARAEQPEALAGVHAPWVLIVVDEASGVPEPIFEAAVGSMAGKNRTTLLIGNPVRTSGLFFDSHHKLKDQWRTYHIHGTRKHTHGTFSERPGDAFVARVAAQYGEESNAYRVRALGEFPRSDLDTIIPYELVASAMQRDVPWPKFGRTVWGLDVAWKGDDLSALCKRRGNVVREPVQVWHNAEAMRLVGSVKAEWDTTPHEERPVAINVDAINYGEGIASRLRELGLPARSVNVAELPAMTGDQFKNLRTELWYLARAWLARRDCALPNDPELSVDLVAARYDIEESSGKTCVEPKKKAKKRGLRSPDRGDAFILTFANSAIVAAGLSPGVFGRREAFKRNTKGVV